MKQTVRLFVGVVVGIVALSGCHRPEAAAPQPEPPAVKKLQISSVTNSSSVGKLILAGQPTKEGFAALDDDGVQTVIDLRTPGEIDWDEPQVVRGLGMEYRRVPFNGAEALTEEIFDQVRELLREPNDGKKLLHCGSGNRVGAVWLPYRVLDQGVPWEVAVEEARAVGLRTPEYEQHAKEYIDNRR